MRYNYPCVDSRTIKVLSLCTGGGGLDRGFSLAVPNSRVVCSVEYEAFACENLASQMEEGFLDDAPIWTNIRTFDGKPWRNVVDCVIGGYPCQPFSLAGTQSGEDDPRHLWRDFFRIVKETEPSIVFFENVPNHINLGFGRVRQDLESIGYKVTQGFFSAEEVGATHQRVRLFIVGYNDSIGCEVKRGLQSEMESRENADRYGNEAVVNATGSGRSEIGQCVPEAGGTLREGKERRLQESSGGSSELGIPLFPPSPDDYEGWIEVLNRFPTLEPALHDLADGMADRNYQLRLLGNGVVPLQSAYAFVSLCAHLFGEEE